MQLKLLVIGIVHKSQLYEIKRIHVNKITIFNPT